LPINRAFSGLSEKRYNQNNPKIARKKCHYCHYALMVESFHVGAVTVNVSRYADGRVCGHWTWGDERPRIVRKTLEQVKKEARRLIQDIKSGDIDVKITKSKAAHIAKLEESLGNTPLEVAVEWYKANHHQAQWTPRRVAELLPEFMERKGDKSPTYQKDCRSHLERLAENFTGYLHEASALEITKWIQAETSGARARNNLRASWVTFFRWARMMRALPASVKTEAEMVEKWTVSRSPIKIYTVEELRALLYHAQKKELWPLVALIILGGLCGIRRHEITGEKTDHQGLTWGDVLWEEEMVRVGQQKIRTKGDRLVPLGDSAQAWLRLCPDRKPEETVFGLRDSVKPMIRLAKVAGVKLKRNGLRKSYITYRMALVQNAHQVADECGNSPEEINASYRRPELKRVALEWFGVLPD
jgi:hypothetical protein